MFETGRIYKRKEGIHALYSGQSQGGISTPSKHPCIFIFTSDAGEDYGYHDKFHSDGMFWYTGEGQIGDMEMARGNAAIRDHHKLGKKLHLFEYVKKGHVRYLGQAQCAGHHIEQRPDRDNRLRNAIIFHLALFEQSSNLTQEPRGNYGLNANSKLSKNLTLSELRNLALKTVSENASDETLKQNIFIRSQAIRAYALKRSNGNCEGCNSPAPFNGKEGPFLEIHHLKRLCDGGPDHPENVIALCPNCHRRAHYSKDAENYNNKLIKLANLIESKKPTK